MALTREQFVEKSIEHIRIRFPLVKVGRAQQTFSLRINGHVASLENLYRIVSLRPDDLVRHVERWVVELLRAAEGTPDQQATFDELRDRIFPMVLTSTTTDMNTGTMVTQPFVENLLIAYAVDSDRTIAYIPVGHFQSWGITLEQLHETALKNLVARSQSMNAHAAQDDKGKVNLILFQTMDGYDASRILLPMLHDRLRGHLGSPFAAGIPNRDILLCFRNDPANVQRLQQQISNDYRNMPHQVTDRLLLVTADGVAPRL
jgi:uncharacterized protein YtpQ (UPF0354 family)